MASVITWKKVEKYFKRDSKIDNWGNPELLDDTHLLRLYDFRCWVKVPVYVIHGVKFSGHAKNSYHYIKNGACATDIIVPDYAKSPYDLVLDATRFGFTGIGYYPHWKFGTEAIGGLHLDSRPLKWDNDETTNYSHSRWLGIQSGNKQEYVELNFHNLLKFSA